MPPIALNILSFTTGVQRKKLEYKDANICHVKGGGVKSKCNLAWKPKRVINSTILPDNQLT